MRTLNRVQGGVFVHVMAGSKIVSYSDMSMTALNLMPADLKNVSRGVPSPFPLNSPSVLRPVSRESRELFGHEKPVVKLKSAWFEKPIIQHDFNIRKTKRTAKFDGLEPRPYEDTKEIVAPEIHAKSFGTLKKHAPAVPNNVSFAAIIWWETMISINK